MVKYVVWRTFIIGFALFEILIGDPYLNKDHIPIILNLFPYHMMVVLPVFCTVAIVMAWRTLKSYYDAIQFVLAFLIWFSVTAIAEDITYFLVSGHVINSADWTCSQLGCLDTQYLSIPVWYITGGWLVAGLHSLRVLFRDLQVEKEEQKVA